jgi:hypothetical protein
MHIPWTPRLRRRVTAPNVPLINPKHLEMLKLIMLEALAPFAEAREALCDAILEFDRRIRAESP